MLNIFFEKHCQFLDQLSKEDDLAIILISDHLCNNKLQNFIKTKTAQTKMLLLIPDRRV